MSYALTNPDDINRYRIRTLRSALKLEILGLKRKGLTSKTINEIKRVVLLVELCTILNTLFLPQGFIN